MTIYIIATLLIVILFFPLNLTIFSSFDLINNTVNLSLKFLGLDFLSFFNKRKSAKRNYNIFALKKIIKLLKIKKLKIYIEKGNASYFTSFFETEILASKFKLIKYLLKKYFNFKNIQIETNITTDYKFKIDLNVILRLSIFKLILIIIFLKS